MNYRDYITNLFVIVDDILNLLAHKHKTNKPKFDDSELITFLIFAMTFIHYKQKERQLYLRKVRKRIETTLSRLYYMGIENIRAILLDGFIAKIIFFVLALQFRMFFNV